MLFALDPSQLIELSKIGSPVRPDIVIEKDNHVTIIDVCCPFENGPEAMEEAVAHKEVKYHHLKTFFEAKGRSCDMYGFAVGALGAWHPTNERVLTTLHMTPCYKNRYAKHTCICSW